MESIISTKQTTVFQQRAQCIRECVTTFSRALYELADGCNFANKNEEIKDSLIIRLQNKGLLERLQIEERQTKTKQNKTNKTTTTTTTTNKQTKNKNKTKQKRQQGPNERGKF